MKKLSSVLFLVCQAAALGCGSSLPAENVEYPDAKVRSMVLELVVEDPRREVMERINQPSEPYKDESVSVPQLLPDGFENEATARLAKIAGDDGLNLKVVTVVERADVTFSNDFRGNMTRYDVKLTFRVTTEKGTLITKGSGQTYQELPHEEATSAEMQRVFLSTALNAFDQYFASEDTIDKINSQIEAYLRSHPDEAR